jgi:hypothetical protein
MALFRQLKVLGCSDICAELFTTDQLTIVNFIGSHFFGELIHIFIAL